MSLNDKILSLIKNIDYKFYDGKEYVLLMHKLIKIKENFYIID